MHQEVDLDTFGGDLVGCVDFCMVMRGAYLLDWTFAVNIREAYFAENDEGVCRVTNDPINGAELEHYLDIVADANWTLKRWFAQDDTSYLQGKAHLSRSHGR